MRNVVIVDACRTVVGSSGGSLRPLKTDALARAAMVAALERAGLEPGQVDEILLGYCRQFPDCPNTARYAALLAGMLETVSASTVMCVYASGILTVNCGFNAMRTGQGQVALAGGTESMSNAIFYLSDARQGVGTGTAQLKDSPTEAQFCSQPQDIYGRFNMDITAESIATKTGVTREERDRFVLASQERARITIAAGRFKDGIVPLIVPQGRKKPDKIFDTDKFPRETSLKLLSRLKPVSLPPDGMVTAGNSSGCNGGASMLTLMDIQPVEEQGLRSLARILDMAPASVSPHYMGLSPALAAQRALEMVGPRLDNIQLIELNGTLAVQSIGCIRELGLRDRMGIVNVGGGAIAPGHPIGSSGNHILVTLMHEIDKRGLRCGLITLCTADGMGMATVVETIQ